MATLSDYNNEESLFNFPSSTLAPPLDFLPNEWVEPPIDDVFSGSFVQPFGNKLFAPDAIRTGSGTGFIPQSPVIPTIPTNFTWEHVTNLPNPSLVNFVPSMATISEPVPIVQVAPVAQVTPPLKKSKTPPPTKKSSPQPKKTTPPTETTATQRPLSRSPRARSLSPNRVQSASSTSPTSTRSHKYGLRENSRKSYSHLVEEEDEEEGQDKVVSTEEEGEEVERQTDVDQKQQHVMPVLHTVSLSPAQTGGPNTGDIACANAQAEMTILTAVPNQQPFLVTVRIPQPSPIVVFPLPTPATTVDTSGGNVSTSGGPLAKAPTLATLATAVHNPPPTANPQRKSVSPLASATTTTGNATSLDTTAPQLRGNEEGDEVTHAPLSAAKRSKPNNNNNKKAQKKRKKKSKYDDDGSDEEYIDESFGSSSSDSEGGGGSSRSTSKRAKKQVSFSQAEDEETTQDKGGQCTTFLVDETTCKDCMSLYRRIERVELTEMTSEQRDYTEAKFKDFLEKHRNTPNEEKVQFIDKNFKFRGIKALRKLTGIHNKSHETPTKPLNVEVTTRKLGNKYTLLTTGMEDLSVPYWLFLNAKKTAGRNGMGGRSSRSAQMAQMKKANKLSKMARKAAPPSPMSSSAATSPGSSPTHMSVLHDASEISS